MNKRMFVPLSLALLATLVVGIALAVSGPTIGWQVISGGGAPATGGGVTLNDTLGQPIIDSSSGGNVTLGAGYWYGLGYDETKCGLIEGSTYAYNQTWPVSVTLQTQGNIACLRVRRYDQNHLNRTGDSIDKGVGWGRYWTITATDSVGSPADGFTLTLTLPHDGLTAPKLCEHVSNLVWDCDDGSHTTSTAGAITRSGITSLSDWAVGNLVGATAVEVKTFSAESGDSGGRWLLVLFTALIGAALLRFTRLRADC